MNKYWIPGPITNYGTTVAGFKGEVRVVEAAEFERYAHANRVQSEEIQELRARLADKEILLAEAVEYGTGYKQAYDEAMANYQMTLARLAEAEALLLASDHDPYNEHIRDGNEWLTRWHAFFGTRVTDSAEPRETDAHG